MRATARIAGLLLAFAAPAQAQDYPNKPIRVIVPYAPGGTGDTMSRAVLDAVQRQLGQTMVIDNRGGGGGRIGSEVVARAAPDGYTLLSTTNGTKTYMAVIEKALGYDPVKDFTPIAQYGVYGLLLAVHPTLPAKNLREFIDHAKSQPGKINYATSGVGSGLHFAAEYFNVLAGVRLVHVPYKGAGAAMQDVIAGAVPVIFSASAGPMVDAGRLRGLGTTSTTRDPRYPDLPTLAEAGLTGYDLGYWVGLLAPPGLPKAIQSRLNAAVNGALKDPVVQKRLHGGGLAATGGSPEVLPREIAAEIAKLRKIASGANLKF